MGGSRPANGGASLILLAEPGSGIERALVKRWLREAGVRPSAVLPLDGPELDRSLAASSPDTVITAARVAWLPHERDSERRIRWADVCGRGEQALLATAHGADAMGVDISPSAIEQARRKRPNGPRRPVRGRRRAEPRPARPGLRHGHRLRAVHTFDDDGRPRYVASLASVLQPGGICYLMCFSDRQPGEYGPRRVRQDELRAAFSDGWSVESIVADTFEVKLGFASRGRGGLAGHHPPDVTRRIPPGLVTVITAWLACPGWPPGSRRRCAIGCRRRRMSGPQ
jgi:SAM-dependent methyltransferase